MTDGPSSPSADELAALRAELDRLRVTVEAIAQRIGLRVDGPGDGAPDDLWDRLGLARDERRLVTVLFADVAGFTELGERLDPEEFHLVMRDAMADLAGCVQREGGYVEKFIGDAVCAIFGAPTAHEDEPQRAARAAAAMHRLLAERSQRRPDLPPLRVHAGINTGIVVAGGVGDGSQFGVMGDTINAANRLMGLAQPGQTFASAHTARRLRRHFQLLDRGLHSVKGRTGPIAVFEIGAAYDGEVTWTGGLRAPLIGRDAEVEAMTRRLEAVAQGRGLLALFTGEAGIGKSRLAGELADRCDGAWLVLRASSRLAGDLPRATVMSALAPLLDRESQTDGLPPSALATMLSSAAATRPVLVVLDDVDQADEATVELVAELVGATRDHRVAWVVVGRRVPLGLAGLAGGAGPDRTAVFRLDPLDETASAALISQLLPGALTASDSLRLARRTEGNPTFVEEIALELIDEGIVVELADQTYRLVGDPDAVEIPGSVTELIEARIDSLATAASVTLQEASVVGVHFRRRLLERVASLPAQVGAALTELRAEELITAPDDDDPDGDDGFWSFRSLVIRDVAYNGILRRRRPPAHRAVAEALLELEPDRVDENAELLAHHYERSDRPERALPYLERAIHHAVAAHQTGAADAIARRAIAVAHHSPDGADTDLMAVFQRHLDGALG